MSGRVERTRLKHMDWWLVAGLSCAWAMAFAWLAIRRHPAFGTGYDLGVYSHVIWTTTQGCPFCNSLVEGTTNFLGHHFVPLLAVLSPIYSVWADARALLAAQAAVVAAGAFPRDARVAADSYFQPWLANRWRIADLGTVPFEQFGPREVPDYLITGEMGPYWVGPPQYPWLIADPGDNPLRVPRFARIASTPGGIGLWQRRDPGEDVRLARYDAAFEGGLILVGAGLPPEAPEWGEKIRVPPGVTLPVWMAWRAGQPLAARITFSLHLVNSRGETVAQADSEMASGHFPTTLWHTWAANPVLADEFGLELPRDLPAGQYRLLAGAFETDSVRPLSRPDGSQWVLISTIEVSP